MKKIIGLIIVSLMLITMIPNILGEEANDPTEEELAIEIETMSIPERAEYRFGQLELSIETQIANAEDILANINVSNETMNELEELVISMELLVDRIDNINLSQDAAILAAEFNAIKKEAREITNEFRSILNSAVRADWLSELQQEIQEAKETRKELVRSRLQVQKENAIIKRNEYLLNMLGIIDEDIMEKVENGELTREEAKELIQEKIESLTDEEKEELNEELKSARDKAKANLQENKAEAKAMMEAKRSELKENRATLIAERKAMFRAKITERITEIKANIAEKRENIKNRTTLTRGNRPVQDETDQ